MKFLLDVHLSRELGELLQERGHVYRMVVDIADPRIEDADILTIARILIGIKLRSLWRLVQW